MIHVDELGPVDPAALLSELFCRAKLIEPFSAYWIEVVSASGDRTQVHDSLWSHIEGLLP